MVVNICLHRRNQIIEVDAQRNGGLVKTSDCREFTLVECTKCRSGRHHTPLLPRVMKRCLWTVPLDGARAGRSESDYAPAPGRSQQGSKTASGAGFVGQGQGG